MYWPRNTIHGKGKELPGGVRKAPFGEADFPLKQFGSVSWHGLPGREHGQDARATGEHGQDARATREEHAQDARATGEHGRDARVTGQVGLGPD
jgi:hypothetical protein